MTTSRQMRRVSLAAIAAALTLAAPATAADKEYVPFVTDFPKPAAPIQVPTAPGAPAAATEESGFQWSSAAAGAGAGLGLALLVGLALAVRTRRTAVA